MLKIGIIGCGKIARVRHIPEYIENPNVELRAFYNRTFDVAQSYEKTTGGKAYASIEELLASDVDAVSVLVPNRDHAAVTIQALKAGKHVLCEKPMATTLEDSLAMVETARETGKVLMIGQNQRLAKSHVKAREIIQSGELGEVIAFETHFAHPGPEGWTGKKDSWFYDKKVASFGVMADLGVHKTDVIRYITGQKIVKTFAELKTLNKKHPDGTPISVDDNAFAIYTLENGAVGTMHVSWTNYGEENNSTIIYLEKGKIRCYDDDKYSLIVENSDGTSINYLLDMLTSNKEQTTGGRTSTGVVDEFVNRILTGTPSLLEGESIIDSMKVIFANEISAKDSSIVEIK
ncbi:MAG: Gfo/Idh/MocA family oxidoreductase [Gudongella sp.]|nr:Gfo/Idh/MocA family oxidoreductase [Gudongella sp.]